MPNAPVREDSAFVGWARDDGTMFGDEDEVEGDTVLHAVYIPLDEAVPAENIFFSTGDMWADIRQRQDRCSYTLVPEDAMERTVIWTSSDTDTAEVDGHGILTLKKTGETTITAALRSGRSNSFTLHVYDPLVTQCREPERIGLDAESMTLRQGEYSQVAAKLMPEPTGTVLLYSSDDDSVASVDHNGVVRAAGPGTAVLHITAAGSEEISTVVTVTVRSGIG